MQAKAYLRRLAQILGFGLMLLGILALSLVDASCQQAALLGNRQMTATVDDLLANPQRFSGRTVTVSAQVDRVISERVIALQSATAGQGMVVILADQALQSVDSIAPSDGLQIVGTVQPLTREQIVAVEQQLGISLDEDQILRVSAQGPMLVAQSVTK